MKDSERDQIDYSVHVFMKESNELLRKYRNDCKFLLLMSFWLLLI